MANVVTNRMIIIDTVGTATLPWPSAQVTSVMAVSTGSAAKARINDGSGQTFFHRAVTGSNDSLYVEYTVEPLVFTTSIVCTLANNMILYLQLKAGK